MLTILPDHLEQDPIPKSPPHLSLIGVVHQQLRRVVDTMANGTVELQETVSALSSILGQAKLEDRESILGIHRGISEMRSALQQLEMALPLPADPGTGDPGLRPQTPLNSGSQQLAPNSRRQREGDIINAEKEVKQRRQESHGYRP